MKFFALLSLVGFAAAVSVLTPAQLGTQVKLPAGQTYVFEYENRMLTGLPQLASHYSGLGIRAKIAIQAKEGNRFVIAINEPRYTKVNQPLAPQTEEEKSKNPFAFFLPTWGQEVNNWRNLQLPQPQPVPAEAARYLSTPMEVEFNENGSFRQMTVSKDEPEWVINYKKAIVAVIQTNWQQGGNSLEQQNEQIQRLQSASPFTPGQNFWKVSEEGIDGRCDVTYQLNELPEYMVKDLPKQAPQNVNTHCPQGSQYFELTKTKDVSSCEKRASFQYFKPGQFNCEIGNCEGMWTRSSVTRFVACGTSQQDMKIQAIYNDGELHQNLFGFNTENFLTGVRQVFRLVETTSQPINKQIDNPVQINTLMYQMSFVNILTGEKNPAAGLKALSLENVPEHEKESKIQQALHQIYKALPRNILHGRFEKSETLGRRSEEPVEQVIADMVKTFNQVVQQDLFEAEQIANRAIPMKILNLARGFTLLNVQQIEQLYQQFHQQFSSQPTLQTVFRNIFFDTAVMGGTGSVFRFLKQKIQTNEMSYVQKEFILSKFSKYVVVPTEDNLQQIYEIVTLPQVAQGHGIHNSAVLGFTVLLEKACISQNREVTYPAFIFGNLCQPNSAIVQDKWIPYLQNLLQSQNQQTRNVALIAFGLMSHKSILPILLPIVERQVPQSASKRAQQENEMERFIAVYALSNVARQNVDEVVPVVYSIFANPAEQTSIRSAAFNVLMNTNPSATVFNKIAAQTWVEKNDKILDLIVSTLYTLSRQETINLPAAANSAVSLKNKARLTVLLCRQPRNAFPSTTAIYSSEYLPALLVGYQQVSGYTSQNGFPQGLYYRLNYYLSAYTFTVAEAGVRFNGVENVVEELVKLAEEIFAPKEQQQLAASVERQISEQWEQLREQLKIKSRENQNSQDAQLSAFINVFENSPMYFELERVTKQTIHQKVKEVLAEGPSALGIKSNSADEFNFQRVIDASPSEFFIPSDNGFPIVIEVHMPFVISIRGRYQVQLNLQQPKVNLQAQQMYATQLVGYVGTICPFTEEFVVTAVDEHSVANLPVEAVVEVNVAQQEVQVTFAFQPQDKNGQKIQGATQIDIVHHHVRPFTVASPYWSMTPLTHENQVQFIKSASPKRSYQSHVGEYLGLDLTTSIQAETQFFDKQSIIERLALYNYNPLNMARFLWTNAGMNAQAQPSFRSTEYRLTLNQANSQTQKMQVQLRFGVAAKAEESSIMKYYFVEPKSSSSQVSGSGRRFSIEKVLPIKVESQELASSSSKHERRQQLLKKVLSELSANHEESASAVTISAVVKLLRANNQIYDQWTQDATLAAANNQRTTKWNIQLQSQQHQAHQPRKICVQGQLTAPQFPVWKIEQILGAEIAYHYQNKIGFGNSCQESTVNVHGSARVSQAQKEKARKSVAAQKLEKMLEKRTPVSELSQIAAEVRAAATTVDEFNYNIEYHNVPQYVLGYRTAAVQALKGIWWTHYTREHASSQQQQKQAQQQLLEAVVSTVEGLLKNSGKNSQGYSAISSIFGSDSTLAKSVYVKANANDHLQVRFNPQANVMDVKIVTPAETVVFRNVRVSPFIRNILPVQHFFNGKLSPYQAVVQSSFTPKCQIEGNHIRNFHNETTSAHLQDGCFHLLAADCSEQSRFQIQVRQPQQNPNQHIVKANIEASELILRPASRSSNQQLDILWEGQPIRVHQRQTRQLHGKDGKVLATIYHSADNVAVIRATYFDIFYDGAKVEVAYKAFTKASKLCGLCGSPAVERQTSVVSGPSECVYSKQELLVASYRTQQPAGECKPLKAQIKRELEQENAQCKNAKVYESTKISESYKSYAVAIKDAMIHKHIVLEKSNEICISRAAVPECSKVARAQGQKQKAVSFTCMQKNRSGRNYAEKARQGQIMPELANQRESQKMTVSLPMTCVLVNGQF